MFNIYLKFDSSLGKDGVARDYSVLGEENFDEIIRRYKEKFEGQYAKRADLGGVGDIDYLIVPYRFFAPSAENPVCMAFGELGEVYYYPINLACYWFSTFPLDSYTIEMSRNRLILDDIKEEYFKSLISLETYTNKAWSRGLYYLSNVIIERYIPFLYDYKNRTLTSFENIAKNRYDLLFQEDGLKQQLAGFLASKGITVIDSNSSENMFPLFFKYIVKYADKKIEKATLGVGGGKGGYNLVKQKGDVFFRPKDFNDFRGPALLSHSHFEYRFSKHRDVTISVRGKVNNGN